MEPGTPRSLRPTCPWYGRSTRFQYGGTAIVIHAVAGGRLPLPLPHCLRRDQQTRIAAHQRNCTGVYFLEAQLDALTAPLSCVNF